MMGLIVKIKHMKKPEHVPLNTPLSISQENFTLLIMTSVQILTYF